MVCAAALGEEARQLVLVASVAPFEDERLLQGMSEGNRQLFALAAGDPVRFKAAFATVTASADALLQAILAGSPKVDRQVFDDADYRAAARETCTLALHQGPDAMLHDLVLRARPWSFDSGAIRCPVTLWHGLADQILPPIMSEALASKITGARLIRVPDAGHFFSYQRWRDVLALALGS